MKQTILKLFVVIGLSFSTHIVFAQEIKDAVVTETPIENTDVRGTIAKPTPEQKHSVAKHIKKAHAKKAAKHHSAKKSKLHAAKKTKKKLKN